MHYWIFGATSGIGKTLGIHLQSEGHRVTNISRTAPDWSPFEHHSLDVTSDDWSALPVPASLDGLIYCPGSIVLKPFRGLKPAQFQEDFEVNVVGAVRAIRHALPALKKGSDPSVVLFSTVAVQQGMPFHASVAAAKGAVEGLTRSLAAELAPTVRVNAVAPSLTQTPLAESLLNNERKQEAANQRHPLHRFGQPDDIARAAAYLLSHSWTSGQVLQVDGGLSTLRP